MPLYTWQQLCIYILLLELSLLRKVHPASQRHRLTARQTADLNQSKIRSKRGSPKLEQPRRKRNKTNVNNFDENLINDLDPMTQMSPVERFVRCFSILDFGAKPPRSGRIKNAGAIVPPCCKTFRIPKLYLWRQITRGHFACGIRATNELLHKVIT